MRPRPKFEQGEMVRVVSKNAHECMPAAPILDVHWSPGFFSTNCHTQALQFIEGWQYGIWEPVAGKIGWAPEQMLRKLPPSERTQWKDCEWQPTDEEVTV